MKHHVTRVLPYAPEQLFEMVGDVARYPEFVPWVTFMRAGPVRAEGEGVEVLDAEAGVGFSFLTERFSTRVRRDSGARRIDVSLLSGPFRHLSNRWSFSPHPTGTNINFDIDFTFKARLLDVLLKANFNRAVDRLIGCFEDRARALYGRTLSAGALAAGPSASTEATSSPS